MYPDSSNTLFIQHLLIQNLIYPTLLCNPPSTSCGQCTPIHPAPGHIDSSNWPVYQFTFREPTWSDKQGPTLLTRVLLTPLCVYKGSISTVYYHICLNFCRSDGNKSDIATSKRLPPCPYGKRCYRYSPVFVRTYPVHVLYMSVLLRTCSVHVCTCYVHVLYMSRTCSVHVLYMFCTCSVLVMYLYAQTSYPHIIYCV